MTKEAAYEARKKLEDQLWMAEVAQVGDQHVVTIKQDRVFTSIYEVEAFLVAQEKFWKQKWENVFKDCD